MRKSRGQIGFIAAVLLAAGLSVQVQAQDIYNWVGGGADNGWTTGDNWGGTAPTWGNTADLVWNSTLTQIFSYTAAANNGTRVAQSLTFGNDFDIGAGNENYSIRLRRTGAADSNILSLRGSPSITLEQNLGLGKDLKTVFIGNNVGELNIRTANLVVNQHSTNVLLRFNAVVTKTDPGPLGIDKNGAGAMELYRNNTFDGGININAGTVALWNTLTAAGSGTITLGAAAGADAATLALGGSASLEQTRANNITVNSGAGARTIRNYESGLVPVIGGNITLNKNVSFDVAIHTAETQDKIKVGGVISGDFGVDKIGDGLLQLDGINTYKGNTTISTGDLLLSDNAGLTFVIGGNGVNNKVTGAGNGTFGGDFYFDLTSAGTTVGDSWTIQDLAGTVSYAATFSVDGFSNAGSGLWTKNEGGVDYQFSESTGILTVIPEPATIGMLGLGALITLVIRRKMGR
jgi:autotransporter-associated beta strand protein